MKENMPNEARPGTVEPDGSVDPILSAFLGGEIDEWIPLPPRVPAFAAETVRPRRTR